MLARDVMSKDVVCVNARESVFDTAEVLLGAGVSAAPVVNDKGAVIGIVSEADLLHRAEIGTMPSKSWLARLLATESSSARDFVTTHARHVADVMTREVITAQEDASLAELVGLMDKHKVKRIPIVRNDALVGVVSRADLLKALLSREAEGPVLRPSDREIRQDVVNAIENKAWTSRWPTNVYANDGVVHLWGFVEDENVRKAYQVAAENVPGVHRVRNHMRIMPAAVGMGI